MCTLLYFREVWEKRPMVLKRHKPHYNEGWFSSEELDSILRKVWCVQPMEFDFIIM